MSLRQLKLDTLKDLDFGRPAVAFEQSVADAVRDCKDRPGDKRPRKVCLEFVLVPVIEQDGDCTGVEGEFKIKVSLPHRQTKPYSFGLTRQGHLLFSDNAPENIEQTTIDDVDPATGRVVRDVIDDE